MPTKNVREMNKFERLHYSLEAKTFQTTIKGALALGLLALLIGISLYTYALVGQYISTSFTLSSNARAITTQVTDLVSIGNETIDIYNTMPENDKAKVGSWEYSDYFADIEQTENYKLLLSILNDFETSSEINNVYFATFDKKESRLIYLSEYSYEGRYYSLGDYIQIDLDQINKFLNWNGEGQLHHIQNVDGIGWLCTSGVPVRDRNGQVIGFILSDVTIGAVARGVRMFAFQFTLAMIIMTFAIAYGISHHIRKAIVLPINKIADAATNYVTDKRKDVKNTNYFSSLEINTGNEIENLALTMSDMENDLNDYEAYLTKMTADKERIETELALAKRIQADMLPNIFPPFPDRSEFDIYATMTPAKEVGGDFYDFFFVDEKHLALVIADVSGKGIPAALFMMISKTLVQNITMTGIYSPGEVLRQVNDQICKNNEEEMFVTIWLGILDTETGKIIYANAGHEHPIMRNPGGNYEIIRTKHGFVAGGIPDLKYNDYEMTLSPGGSLFVYTDGVPESTNENNEQFGLDRTLVSLNSTKDKTAQGILESVQKSVNDFIGDAPQFDDLTMLCINYLGSNKESNEITIDATMENMPSVMEFIDGALEKLDANIKIQTQMDVALDEILSNTIRYAYYPNTGKATIRYTYYKDTRVFEVMFIDSGTPYNPLKHEDPDITLSSKDRPIGGLGIFIVKKTMDEVLYNYENGHNILTIRKKI